MPISAAPVAAALAGARRRTARRRAATAVGGVAVFAGLASGVGIALAGSPQPRPLPPGRVSSPPAPHPSSAATGWNGVVSARHVAQVTAQDGLAPGQQPAGKGPVMASGTVDGVPWQIRIIIKDGATGSDPDVGVVAADEGGPGSTCIRFMMSEPGLDTMQGGVSCSIPVINSNDSVFGPTVFVVPANVTTVVWSGEDGFRDTVATLPPHPYGRFGDQRLAVFPDMRMNAQLGDEFTGYDADGKQVTIYNRITQLQLDAPHFGKPGKN